jgi:hypothetical protein
MPEKSHFWSILESLGIEKIGIPFYDQLVHLLAICCILWLLCICFGHLVYLWPCGVYFMAIWYILISVGIFFPFLVCSTKKNQAFDDI